MSGSLAKLDELPQLDGPTPRSRGEARRREAERPVTEAGHVDRATRG